MEEKVDRCSFHASQSCLHPNRNHENLSLHDNDQNPYPSASDRHLLVQLTDRTVKQVQDWFSNRRRNDPRLVSTVYYSSPPPPYSMCPCCSQLPNLVYDFSTIYYPPLNYFRT